MCLTHCQAELTRRTKKIPLVAGVAYRFDWRLGVLLCFRFGESVDDPAYCIGASVEEGTDKVNHQEHQKGVWFLRE